MAKKMTITEITDILTNKGWNKDRWGHLKISSGDRNFRLKVQKTSVRLEVRAESIKEWVRIDGSYLKDINLVERNGKNFIKVGRRLL